MIRQSFTIAVVSESRNVISTSYCDQRETLHSSYEPRLLPDGSTACPRSSDRRPDGTAVWRGGASGVGISFPFGQNYGTQQKTFQTR